MLPFRAAINSHRSPVACICMQIIRVRHDVAFIADIPIQMKGVQLEVPSDSLMVFGAPYLKFEKGEVRAGSHTSIWWFSGRDTPLQDLLYCYYILYYKRQGVTFTFSFSSGSEPLGRLATKWTTFCLVSLRGNMHRHGVDEDMVKHFWFRMVTLVGLGVG